MIIKIDVDGVIRNINETMCRLYNEAFGTNLSVNDIFDYDVKKVFTKFQKEFNMNAADYFFKLFSKVVFMDSNPYDGVKEAIERLRLAGHKVVIVTWQFNTENKYNTLLFFEKNNIPYDDICFTRDKWMIQGDWLIDDNPEFITDERDKSKKILINMPYNKNLDYNVIRADNLKQAVDIILKREEIIIPIEAVEVNNYKNMFNYDTD